MERAKEMFQCSTFRRKTTENRDRGEYATAVFVFLSAINSNRLEASADSWTFSWQGWRWVHRVRENESLPCNRGFDRVYASESASVWPSASVYICVQRYTDSSLAACARNLLSILQSRVPILTPHFRPLVRSKRRNLEFLRRDRKVLRRRLPRNRIAYLGSFLIAFHFFRAAFRNQLADDKSLYHTRLSIDDR